MKPCNRNLILSILKNEVTGGIAVIISCAIALAVIWSVNLPIAWQKYKDPHHEQGLIAIIGGIFALVASGMTLVQIVGHFRHQIHRQSQKRMARILAIVPVYAITSWIAILFFISAIYMDFIKSCFEAYVIYCFLLLLTKYLGGHRGVEQLLLGRDFVRLVFPFCCIKFQPHAKWVWYFKIGLLQYTWISPICSAMAIVLNLANVYDNGEWKFNRGYPYIIIIINISQILALYSLIIFYVNTKHALKPFKPLPKFLVIKLIVFFIFWQSVLMSGLAKLGVLRNTTCDPATDVSCNGSTTGFTVEQEKILLENILICVEMFFFAIAHHWIFGWKQYADGRLKQLMELRFRELNDNQEDVDQEARNINSFYIC